MALKLVQVSNIARTHRRTYVEEGLTPEHALSIAYHEDKGVTDPAQFEDVTDQIVRNGNVLRLGNWMAEVDD